MNSIAVFAIFLVVVLLPANGELRSFRQVVDDAQAEALELHQQMENEFDRQRETTSQHIGTIAADVLRIILAAIEEVTTLYDQCPAAGQEFDRLGKELSACALTVDHAIGVLITEFYEALEEPQAASIAALSTVLEHVGRINGVDSPAEVAHELSESLGVLRNQVNGQMMTEIRAKVAAIEAGIVNVPQIGQTCVDAVVAQLDGLQC